jgi:V-type H+-transporting ATPase subunit F
MWAPKEQGHEETKDKRARHEQSADLSVETQTSVIEAAFQDFTERKDIAILLINQHVRPPCY